MNFYPHVFRTQARCGGGNDVFLPPQRPGYEAMYVYDIGNSVIHILHIHNFCGQFICHYITVLNAHLTDALLLCDARSKTPHVFIALTAHDKTGDILSCALGPEV